MSNSWYFDDKTPQTTYTFDDMTGYNNQGVTATQACTLSYPDAGDPDSCMQRSLTATPAPHGQHGVHVQVALSSPMEMSD